MSCILLLNYMIPFKREILHFICKKINNCISFYKFSTKYVFPQLITSYLYHHSMYATFNLFPDNAYSIENDVLVSLTENETILYEKNIEHLSRNVSSIEKSKLSSINYASVSNIDKIKNSNVDDKEYETVTTRDDTFESISSNEIQITEYNIDEDKEVHAIQLKTRIYQGVYSFEIEYEALIDENVFFIGNYSTSGEER